MIELGARVKCKYTGLRGTATQRVKYLGNPVDKICVQPDSDSSDGHLPTAEFVPESWLEIEKAKKAGFSH